MNVSVNVVSAFTASGKGGNIAGVVLDAGKLTPEEMQMVAAKAGYAETAFVTSCGAEYSLRFFDPLSEVDLCGHATIAAWSLMHRNYGLDYGKYIQNTKAGKLGVDISDDEKVFMEQTAPDFKGTLSIKEVALSLGVGISSIREDLAPQVVSTGLSTLLVALDSQADLKALKPNIEAMSELSKKYGFILVHSYVLSPKEGSLATVRNFGPSLGVFEDIATGTSNGALLCYLRRKNILSESEVYRIEQGANMGELSYVYGKFEDEEVWIGGDTTLLKRVEIEIG